MFGEKLSFSFISCTVFCEFCVCACAWAEPSFSAVLLLFALAENYSGELLHKLLHVCIVLVVALKE